MFVELSVPSARNADVAWVPGIGCEGPGKGFIIWPASRATLARVSCRPVSSLLFWTPDCSAKRTISMSLKATTHLPMVRMSSFEFFLYLISWSKLSQEALIKVV